MSNHERSAGHTTPATITGQIAGIFAMSNLCARKASSESSGRAKRAFESTK